MRALVVLILVVAALVPLTACEQDSLPSVELKKDKNVSDEPTLPPFFLEGFKSPVRATTTPEGRFLVTDAQRRMVLRVDPGTLLPEQGLRLSYKPSAVGLLGRRIYVGNPERHTVEIYATRGGTYSGSFAPGVVGYAMDIAVDAGRDLVFVLDGASRTVALFTPDGAILSTFGGGGGAGQLTTPIGVALDTSRQEVLVSDYGTPPTIPAAVKIYSYGGTYRDEISGAGRCGMLGCSGGFSRPQGLAVSRLGRVFLADGLLSQVLVYDRSTKTLLRTLGGYPALHSPSDVVIGKSNDLFVVSNLTASVVLFAQAAAQ